MQDEERDISNSLVSFGVFSSSKVKDDKLIEYIYDTILVPQFFSAPYYYFGNGPLEDWDGLDAWDPETLEDDEEDFQEFLGSLALTPWFGLRSGKARSGFRPRRNHSRILDISGCGTINRKITPFSLSFFFSFFFFFLFLFFFFFFFSFFFFPFFFLGQKQAEV